MSATVCVLTGKGHSAIGSIALWGPQAEVTLGRVFRPSGKFEGYRLGGIYHGHIIEAGNPVDDVVMGCEGQHQFVIHCHGNPILLEKIFRLCLACGAQQGQLNTVLESTVPAATLIEKEACIEQLGAVTLDGVRIIQSQIDAGLSAAIRGWMNDTTVSVDSIHQQCRHILDRSIVAGRIIHGVRIVLAGPPNSGKSALLNALAGSEKAIVSDTAGTTRDWVSAAIKICPFRAEIIDTAGLDPMAIRQSPDAKAQQMTLALLRECDCIVLLEDATNPSIAIPTPESIPVVQVVNKCDLFQPKPQTGHVYLSAKTGRGIDALLETITRTLGAQDLKPGEPIAFTPRQKRLLEDILQCHDISQIQRILRDGFIAPFSQVM
ncbi:MAG: GTP-binding protein [Sedimentisphaerales bacterium]|nr:GTP-binding protein [Sedimentisphaerales bacterium]